MSQKRANFAKEITKSEYVSKTKVLDAKIMKARSSDDKKTYLEQQAAALKLNSSQNEKQNKNFSLRM